MRRKDRLLTNSEALSILKSGEYGILSSASPEGLPYGVPLYYCFIDSSIYFHSALKGRKLDNIVNNPAVSFCVVGATQIQPDKFATKFESCIVEGKAKEVFGDEKIMALKGLVKKYSGEFQDEGDVYIEKAQGKVRIIKIIPGNICGKGKR